MMLYKVPSLIALSVALAGCSLAPDYQSHRRQLRVHGKVLIPL